MPAADDRRARFEQLFAANHRAVHAYVRRRAPAAVDDVVADTFLVAWRRLDTVDDDALPWLLGVARRQVANHLRAQRRRDALTLRLKLLPGPPERWNPPRELAPELASAV